MGGPWAGADVSPGIPWSTFPSAGLAWLAKEGLDESGGERARLWQHLALRPLAPLAWAATAGNMARVANKSVSEPHRGTPLAALPPPQHFHPTALPRAQHFHPQGTPTPQYFHPSPHFHPSRHFHTRMGLFHNVRLSRPNSHTWAVPRPSRAPFALDCHPAPLPACLPYLRDPCPASQNCACVYVCVPSGGGQSRAPGSRKQ